MELGVKRWERVIWQYWETVNEKPAFIDGLHEIAKRNSGLEVILVTPETLRDYLPNIPPEILRITEIAHKADMIRTMLVMQYGGMWLDSDAIVLQKLDWILDLLDSRSDAIVPAVVPDDHIRVVTFPHGKFIPSDVLDEPPRFSTQKV